MEKNEIVWNVFARVLRSVFRAGAHVTVDGLMTLQLLFTAHSETKKTDVFLAGRQMKGSSLSVRRKLCRSPFGSWPMVVIT